MGSSPRRVCWSASRRPRPVGRLCSSQGWPASSRAPRPWRPASTSRSQADTERADLERERGELATNRPAEQEELAAIYVERGLSPALAQQVAREFMAKDALAAHGRDELGIVAALRARPVQAALTSALTFAVGAALPLLVVLVTPDARLVPAVAGASLLCLGGLGWLAARTGGARPLVGAVRVVVWGAIAMGLTAGIGALFGTRAG